MQQMIAAPENYQISYLDWDIDKATFVEKLADVFSDYVIDAEKSVNAYGYVTSAMKRWYLSLPKYTKESKKTIDGQRIDAKQTAMLKLLKQEMGSQELLFEKLPKAFGNTEFKVAQWQEMANYKKNVDAYLKLLHLALIEEVKKLFVLPANEPRIKAMSLASVIKDWCESLDQKVFEQLFTDGTDKCLALFKTISNDDQATIVRAAKMATGLRTEDWDDNTYKVFMDGLKRYKKTAEAFVSKPDVVNEKESVTSNYKLSYIDDTGVTVTKRFEKIDFSKRAKLLMNTITADLDAMGHAITEQEKRQVLMEILKKLC